MVRNVLSLTVLGTAVPGGWPDAHCRCASCAAARAAGEVRGPTAALLDRQLLLDVAPSTPLDTQRAGGDLAGLRHLLVTHDCAGVEELLRDRSAHVWDEGQPLDLVAPASRVDRLLGRLDDDASVRAHRVRGGDHLRMGAYDVRVLDPGPADGRPREDVVAFDVTGPAGRVLFAPVGGPLPPSTVEALGGADVDVALLGLPDDMPELLADELRRLRGAGAVSGQTDVVACGLSHQHRSPAELSRVLDAWGVRVVEDGTTLGVDPRRDATPQPFSRDGTRHLSATARAVGRTVVIGGARSGKSREAELLLADQDAVVYVATSYPPAAAGGPDSENGTDGTDPEWAERVRVHRERRPAHWSTLETIDLVPLLETDGPALLVDCLTLWLTRVMDRHDAWDDEVWAGTGEKGVAHELDALVRAWRTTPRRVVAVTNEVGQGLVPDGSGSRRFRDTMGRLNAALCAVTEDVRWCVAGRVVRL